MIGFRSLAFVLAITLLLTGPLAPLAWAQQPRPAEEAAKAPEAKGTDPYKVGAVAVNVVRVPGKALLCTLSGGVAFVALLITFGTAHRTAAWAIEQGCGGPWTITAQDLKAPREQEPERMY